MGHDFHNVRAARCARELEALEASWTTASNERDEARAALKQKAVELDAALRNWHVAEAEIERLKGQPMDEEGIRAIVRVAVAAFVEGLDGPTAEASVYPSAEDAALVEFRKRMGAKGVEEVERLRALRREDVDAIAEAAYNGWTLCGSPDHDVRVATAKQAARAEWERRGENPQLTFGQDVILEGTEHQWWRVSNSPQMMVRVVPVYEGGLAPDAYGSWVAVEKVKPLPPSPPTCGCGASRLDVVDVCKVWVLRDNTDQLAVMNYCPECGEKLVDPSTPDEPAA